LGKNGRKQGFFQSGIRAPKLLSSLNSTT